MTQAGSQLSRQEAVDAIWHQRGPDTGNPAAGTKSTGPAHPSATAGSAPDRGAGSDGPTRRGTTTDGPMPVLEVRNPELMESAEERR